MRKEEGREGDKDLVSVDQSLGALCVHTCVYRYVPVCMQVDVSECKLKPPK
jgi:hypothetical protein